MVSNPVGRKVKLIKGGRTPRANGQRTKGKTTVEKTTPTISPISDNDVKVISSLGSNF